MKKSKERLHSVIVIGATPAGITAVNKLGELGIPVTLVDTDANLDRKLANPEWKLRSGMPLNHAHRPGLIRILRNGKIRCLLPAKVTSLRHSPQGFRVGLCKLQTFTDLKKCVLCGLCAEICPVCPEEGHKAVQFDGRLSLPGRPVIDKRRLPLCRENCPLGVNAQGYVALTKAGKYAQALELVRERNILPGICGRVCNHPCEKDCRRGQLDDPVAIRDIKRFLADYDASHPDEIAVKKPAEKRGEKFAVIGSGPAGLAAAAELARQGCQVTVFEKEKEIGGLMRYGIGPHRLPRNILDAELEYIRKLGVEFVPSHSVNLAEISSFAEKFDAVILATGSWKDRKLGAPGEDLQGVEGCLSFLNRFYRGEISECKEKVAVIGDGNAAFDLARTLCRIGSDVTILSWFEKEKIPADPEEMQGALEEGIVIKDKCQVVEFLGENGRLSRVKCRPTKPGKADAKGIEWPVMVKDGQPFEMAFDRVFVSIGQAGPFAPGVPMGDLKITDYGFIAADENFCTGIPKVYAIGDAVTGPSTVVRAMACGKNIAANILCDICHLKTETMQGARPDRDFPEIPKNIPTLSRIPMPEMQTGARIGNFAEVALGLSEEQVRYEAGRCLQCGVCSECMQCADLCQAGAVDHSQKEEELIEHAGVVIIADPDLAPAVKGDDVIRAYGSKSAKNDVYAMMMRGYAAAAQALITLGTTSYTQKGSGVSFYQPDPGLSPDVRIGVFVCRCNDSLGWSDEIDQYVENLAQYPHVVHSQTIASACVPEGINTMVKTFREKGITRIVLGSCVCCPLNFVCSACTDQRTRLKHGLFTATGISRSMIITRNIRGEALSLLKTDAKQAVKRLKGLIDRSVKRAPKLNPFPTPVRLYNFTTAVIGQSKAARTAALMLAETGADVFMFGTADMPLKDAPVHPNIHAFEDAKLRHFSGALGDFQLEVETRGYVQNIQAGAVILGEKSRKKIPYIHQQGLPAKPVISDMQSAGVTGLPFFYPGMTSISGLFLANPAGISISDKLKGSAAAMLAAAVMPHGPRQSKGFTVNIKQALCRGCGQCIEKCLYQAISMKQNETGGWYACVDEAFCKGCGNCISVCPTNAADSPFRSQKFFEETLGEILLQ